MDEQNTGEIEAPINDTQEEVVDQSIDAEGTTESATEEAPAKETGLPKGVEKRFAKLTKERYALQNELEALRAQVAQMSKEPEPELTKADFGENEDGYLEYRVEQKLQAKMQQMAQAQAKQQAEQQEMQVKQQDWHAKIQSYAAELPNYAQLVENADVVYTQDDIDNIMESDIGPKIAYELATNSDLADKFSSYKSQRQRDKFLTKLEIQLENQPKKQKPVSQAPAPTPKMGGGSKGGNIDPANLSMEDFVKWRNGLL